MNIRYIMLLACVLISFYASSQKKKKNESEKDTKSLVQPTLPAGKSQNKKDSTYILNVLSQHYARKYAIALQWSDYEVAKDALYDLIIENPENDSLLFDLALYYYQNQKSPSAVLVANELISRNPKNTAALEISAGGYESLGLLDKALQNYETLYLLTNNVNVLYKMAFIQYRLKRYKECLISSDIILANKDLETLKASFSTPDNKNKEYPVKVAVLNLKGMVALDQGDKTTAKKFFEQALSIAPDFFVAKENLAKTK